MKEFLGYCFRFQVFSIPKSRQRAPWIQGETSLLLFAAAILLLFSLHPEVFAQTIIAEAVKKLDQGKTEEVRRTIPDLIAQYQSDPGVTYLQGRLASNGQEALNFYQSVVENFPNSEWSDDALYRMYQYYQAMGLYRSANAKLSQLKKAYPDSPYRTEGKTSSSLQQQAVEIGDTKPESPSDVETTPMSRPKPKSHRAQHREMGRYSLQVGAFSTSENAEKQRTFFEAKGFPVEITNKVRNSKSLYLVQVGADKSAAEAKRAGKLVQSKFKIASMIIERD